MRWSEEIARVDRRGAVYVRLGSEQRSLLLRVSAPGADARVLVPGRFGDVSYTEVVGLPQPAAADRARAYAVRLGADASLPKDFPHLAVAAAAGRAPGSCRTAVAELWPAGMTLPAARSEVRLNPSGLLEFLAPELRLDVTTRDGFTLRGVHVGSPHSPGSACVLEFEPPAEAQAANPTLIAIGALENGSEAFGSPQRLSLALRPGDAEHGDRLQPAVARLCSWLVALIELKQAPDFTVRGAEAGTDGSAGLAPGQLRSIERGAPGVSASSAASGSSTRSASGVSHGASPIPDVEMQTHRFNLLASGFTRLHQVLSPATVAALAADVDRALEATRLAVADGRQLAYTFYDEETYLGTRCVYCWGDECTALLENDVIRRVAEAVIGAHRLFDMSALRALPAAPFAHRRTEWWHRDIDVIADGPQNVRYLWFFVLLDDFTADNGATWVVPGSQRIPNSALPKKKHFPTAVQLLAEAGDVIAINPSALHTVGHNVTDQPRTIINVSMCHADVRPLMDHWSIAGPAIQARASQRLREVLGADDRPLGTTWSVLPEGWITAPRPAETTASERTLPTEQQGYQREHHMRDGLLLPDRPGNRPGDEND